jgi:hypothetical protein
VEASAAVIYSLIVSAKMNDIDPKAWFAGVLARITKHPVQRLDDLLPWNWHKPSAQASIRRLTMPAIDRVFDQPCRRKVKSGCRAGYSRASEVAA